MDKTSNKTFHAEHRLALPYDLEVIRLPSRKLMTFPLGITEIVVLESAISDNLSFRKHFLRVPDVGGFSHVCMNLTGECVGCEYNVKSDTHYAIRAAYYGDARHGYYDVKVLEAGRGLFNILKGIEKERPDTFIGSVIKIHKDKDDRGFYRYYAYPTGIRFDVSLFGDKEQWPTVFDAFTTSASDIRKVYDAMFEIKEKNNGK